MAEFIYNNTKNASTGHIPFQLNYGYYSHVFFEENTNPRSWLKTADKLSVKLKELSLYHSQELQKWAHNKGIKPQSYALGNKF